MIKTARITIPPWQGMEDHVLSNRLNKAHGLQVSELYSGCCSFTTPTGRDASPSRVSNGRQYPFTHLGKETIRRKQHHAETSVKRPYFQSTVQHANHQAMAPPLHFQPSVVPYITNTPVDKGYSAYVPPLVQH